MTVESLSQRVSRLEGIVETLLITGGEEWQKTSEAARVLDYSAHTLRLWVNEPHRSPYLMEGVHYNRHKNGYKFNILECKKAIDNHTQRIES